MWFLGKSSQSKPVQVKLGKIDGSFTLQNNINSCAIEWQLPLNISKCKILHLGHLNSTMDGNLLKEDSEEKDLGMKFYSHTESVVNKANRLFKYCFVTLSSSTFTTH